MTRCQRGNQARYIGLATERRNERLQIRAEEWLLVHSAVDGQMDLKADIGSRWLLEFSSFLSRSFDLRFPGK